MPPTENTGRSSQRETILTVTLIFLVGGGFILFMVFVTGGFFAYVLAISAALGLFGCFHYLLWGHRMSQSVQKELEAMKEEAEREQDSKPSPPWERRF